MIDKIGRFITPPYTRKELISIGFALFLLLSIPITVTTVIFVRDFRPKATEGTAEANVRPLISDAEVNSRPIISKGRVFYAHMLYTLQFPGDPNSVRLYNMRNKEDREIAATVVAPNYSIDGEKLVYTKFIGLLPNASDEVFVNDLSTGQETRITNDTFSQRSPSISYDRIVWEDNRNGNWDIYYYDLSSNTERRITTSSADQLKPKTDGLYIVWEDYRSGNSDIYSYNIGTNVQTRVTSGLGNELTPFIDRSIVVWQDTRNDGGDIYMKNLLSGTETRITTNSAKQSEPSISDYIIAWKDERNDLGDIYIYDPDWDGDGFSNGKEYYIGTSLWDHCSTNGWPANLAVGGIPDSTYKITISDLTSFLAPVYRLNSSKGSANYSQRWDLDASGRIDITDLVWVINLYPPMFNGQRALGGPACDPIDIQNPF